MKVGIVLSGGGARGITHLGVLKALEELGVKFDCISGTSVGALIGAFYSQGYSPDEILNDILTSRFYRSVRPAWRWTGLLSLDSLRAVLLKYIPHNDFGSLKIPLVVAATNISHGKTEYFSSGELIPRLLASCCVPAVFSPVQLNGALFVDGGIMDNLPAKAIRQQCDFLIGVHCNFLCAEFDAKNFRSVVERSLMMAIHGNSTLSKSLCDLTIEPEASGKVSTFDIGKAKELFEIGYQFTKQHFKASDFPK
ncbi:MAG TPA: patatin-like phospholipase family protein [Chryseolinea sp.]|nr:patatin-like phospholipase family protein [Chryseolinea sp.]